MDQGKLDQQTRILLQLLLLLLLLMIAVWHVSETAWVSGIDMVATSAISMPISALIAPPQVVYSYPGDNSNPIDTMAKGGHLENFCIEDMIYIIYHPKG